MDKIIFHTAYNPPKVDKIHFSDASLTRQEFAKDADINNVMAKYASGDMSLFRGSRPPIFGDFSDLGDYDSNLQKVIDAQEKFAQLPSKVRKRFDNDPSKLLQFLLDEKNRSEAIDLGLIEKPASNSVSDQKYVSVLEGGGTTPPQPTTTT